MSAKIDWKKVFTHKATTHSAAAVLGLALGLLINNGAKKANFEKAETEQLNVHGREYFDPNVWPQVNWTNHSNQHVAQLFGETIAKEMAMDIDSIFNRTSTPGKLYGLDYNYCNAAVTTAIRDAALRIKLKKKGKVQTFVGRESIPALTNGDSLVAYFGRNFENTVDGAIVRNPTTADFSRISTGSVVRFPGHSKLFMGFGYVDESGHNFVPSKRGKPVIASGYNDKFSYFEDAPCIVVDIPKIIQYKLQNEVGRHTR